MTDSLKAQIKAMEDNNIADNFKETSLSQVLKESDGQTNGAVTGGPPTVNMGTSGNKNVSADPVPPLSARNLNIDDQTVTVTETVT